MRKVHIRRLIREKFEASGLTKKAFAKKINLSSRHVYSLFERESVDTWLLQRISEVLNHNFFSVFTESSRFPHPIQAQEPAGASAANMQLKMEIISRGTLNKKEILGAVKEELDELL